MSEAYRPELIHGRQKQLHQSSDDTKVMFISFLCSTTIKRFMGRSSSERENTMEALVRISGSPISFRIFAADLCEILASTCMNLQYASAEGHQAFRALLGSSAFVSLASSFSATLKPSATTASALSFSPICK